MASTAFVPDYDDYFRQETHSDVSLLITDDAAVSGDASLARRLPGHSMVLVPFSDYCRAKLETLSQAGCCQGSSEQDATLAWLQRPFMPLGAVFNYCKTQLAPRSYAGAYNSSSIDGKLEVLMQVPKGQQELAKLLVKGMYQAQPTTTDGLSQLQLLQLMLLADHFDVPKVQAAVAAALSTVDVQQLDWDAAVQLLQLPPSCAQQPEFEAVRRLAVQRVQQQLGDLEEVWADPARQQLLLALPFEALRQLLQDDTTCVATENTVVYTIERWWGAQYAALQHAEHLRALMHLVRMRHCTQYFAGIVMQHSSLVQQSFERTALPLMRECCTLGGFARLQDAKCPVLQQCPAWVAEQRPASARQPVVEWRLPLASLQAPVEQLLSSGGIATVGFSDTCVVQGQPMRIKVEIKAVDTDDKAADTDRAPVLHIGAFLGLRDLPAGSMRLVAATISVLPLKAAAPPSKTTGELTERLMSPERIWGFPQLVPLGTQRSWQAVKAELYRMELVHGGASAAAVPDQEHSSHLHIKVEVKQLL
uniref:BACK domain-containing protein n=1 Tax=Tetradesmus obliquus TaxID=3088 RepID=A0A383W8E4_TETOB|eukprot:jgi/Sobl393_1/2832/SZX73915.1